MAVGNPLGLAGTVTTGIVSALNRPVTTEAEERDPEQQDPFGQNAQQQGGDRSSPTRSRPARRSTPATAAARSSTPSGQLVGINSSIASARLLRGRPERQHRHRLRHPGQRGDLDRRPADRQRQGRARLPRREHRRTTASRTAPHSAPAASVTAVVERHPGRQGRPAAGRRDHRGRRRAGRQRPLARGPGPRAQVGDTAKLTIVRGGQQPGHPGHPRQQAQLDQ